MKPHDAGSTVHDSVITGHNTREPSYNEIVIAITGGRDYTPTELQLRSTLYVLDEIAHTHKGVSLAAKQDMVTYHALKDVIDLDKELYSGVSFVHGKARGVDITVGEYLERLGRTVIACPIDPTLDGNDSRYMGFNRNERMLATYRPVALIAFPGGRGTEDCIRRAKKKGIKVYYAGQV